MKLGVELRGGLKNLTTSLALDKLTYVVRKKASEFYVWEMFLEFVTLKRHWKYEVTIKLIYCEDVVLYAVLCLLLYNIYFLFT